MWIFRPRVVGVAWVEMPPPPSVVRSCSGGGDGLAFLGFVFIFSTSKLYKNMQHTSWPKKYVELTHIV